jgi:hypothetical protein
VISAVASWTGGFGADLVRVEPVWLDVPVEPAPWAARPSMPMPARMSSKPIAPPGAGEPRPVVGRVPPDITSSPKKTRKKSENSPASAVRNS